MAIPDFETLMKPLLELAAKDEVNRSSAEEAMAGLFKLTMEERESLVPSQTISIIRNRIGWALSDLAKAGLLERPRRGVYNITPNGREFLARNPKEINRKILLSEANSQTKTQIEQINIETTKTPEELIDSASKELNNRLKDELLEIISNNSPKFFEALIVELLLKMGYGGGLRENVVQHLGRSHDGGVDGIINQDVLGLERIYIQAKRYKIDTKVGIETVRAFSGTLKDKQAGKGVFVTTSSFTSEALGFFERNKEIIPVDSSKLTGLMLRYNVGVVTSYTIDIKKIDENFFEDY